MNNNIFWFCVYTNAREENLAYHELLHQGFDIYFPLYRRIVRHARKIHEKICPFFPRYFFALNNNTIPLSVLKRTRGVGTYIHQYDGTPVPVANKVIDLLKAREDSQGYIRMNDKRFKKGDQVIVTQGSLNNLSAIFLTQKDEERANILLKFLGREHKLSMPLDYLERINA